jgi:hypothetical protein
MLGELLSDLNVKTSNYLIKVHEDMSQKLVP